MATMRRHVRIRRSADDVWAVIADAGAIAEWFPSMTASRVEGDRRWVTLGSGMEAEEQIVTSDDEMRRFQYRMVGAPGVTDHLATVDVFDLGADDSLLVYSTDVAPPPLALVMGGAIGEAIESLRDQLEAAR